MEPLTKSFATRTIPGDITRLPAGATGIKLGAVGMLITVSNSFGFSVGNPKISMNELPQTVSRDAFVLFGSRTVGFAAGTAASRKKLDSETDRKITSIVLGLDSLEGGLAAPVWRSIARAFHIEALGGSSDVEDIHTMADAVLSLHQNISDIYNAMRVSFAKVDDKSAEPLAKLALVAIAYGNSGLVGNDEDDLHAVIDGPDTDLRDFAAVASSVCDSARCKNAAIRVAASSILVEGARKFREIIISSMAASLFIAHGVPNGTSVINPDGNL